MAETLLVEFPHLADLPPTLVDTTTGTPDRRLGSVRRTATIDMTWPGGFGTPLELVGHARDLLTPIRGAPEVLAEASMRASIDNARMVTAIESTPARPGTP